MLELGGNNPSINNSDPAKLDAQGRGARREHSKNGVDNHVRKKKKNSLQSVKPQELVEYINTVVTVQRQMGVETGSKYAFIIDDPNFPVIVEIDFKNHKLALSYRKKAIGFRWWRNSRNLAADRAKEIIGSIYLPRTVKDKDTGLEVEIQPLVPDDVQYDDISLVELTRSEFNKKKAGDDYGFPKSYLQSKVPQTVTGTLIAFLGIGAATALYVLPLVSISIGIAITTLPMLALFVLVSVAVGAIVYKAISKVREKIADRRTVITTSIIDDVKQHQTNMKASVNANGSPRPAVVVSSSESDSDYQSSAGETLTTDDEQRYSPGSSRTGAVPLNVVVQKKPAPPQPTVVPKKSLSELVEQFNGVYLAYARVNEGIEPAAELLKIFMRDIQKSAININDVINQHNKKYNPSYEILKALAVYFSDMEMAKPILRHDYEKSVIQPTMFMRSSNNDSLLVSGEVQIVSREVQSEQRSTSFVDMLDSITAIRVDVKKYRELGKSTAKIAAELAQLKSKISTFIEVLPVSQRKMVTIECETLAEELVKRFDFDQVSSKLDIIIPQLTKIFQKPEKGTAEEKEALVKTKEDKERAVLHDIHARFDQHEKERRAIPPVVIDLREDHFVCEAMRAVRGAAEEKIFKPANELTERIRVKNKIDILNDKKLHATLASYSHVGDKIWFLLEFRGKIEENRSFTQTLQASLCGQVDQIIEQLNRIQLRVLEQPNSTFQDLANGLQLFNFDHARESAVSDGLEICYFDCLLSAKLAGKNYSAQLAELEKILEGISPRANRAGFYTPSYTPKQTQYIQFLKRVFDAVVHNATISGELDQIRNYVDQSRLARVKKL